MSAIVKIHKAGTSGDRLVCDTAQARACAIALQGDGFVWDQLMDHAIHSAVQLKAFVQLVAKQLAVLNGCEGDSLATLKRNKIKGASTLEVYSGQLARLATAGCLTHPIKGEPLTRQQAAKILKAVPTSAGVAGLREYFAAWATEGKAPTAAAPATGEGEGGGEGEGATSTNDAGPVAGITPAMALACIALACAAGDREALQGLERLANQFCTAETVEVETRVIG